MPTSKEKREIRAFARARGIKFNEARLRLRRATASADDDWDDPTVPLELEARRALLTRTLATLAPADVHWFFRDDPELRDRLRGCPKLSLQSADATLLQRILDCDVLALNGSSRSSLLARTLEAQFDAHFETHGTAHERDHFCSEAMHKAGIERFYVRFLCGRLEPCLGELEVCDDPVRVFEQEILPFLRHIVQKLQLSFIEIQEVGPALGRYLRDAGWRDGNQVRLSRAYERGTGWARCKLSVELWDVPSPLIRSTCDEWVRAEEAEREVAEREGRNVVWRSDMRDPLRWPDLYRPIGRSQ